MDLLTIEGWHKADPSQKSKKVGNIRFRVSPEMHLKLEQAEQQLQESGDKEAFVDANMADLELETPAAVGELKDCKFRVYLDAEYERGHFHLTANRVEDDSLVYTNAVMVDQFD